MSIRLCHIKLSFERVTRKLEPDGSTFFETEKPFNDK